MAGVDIVLTTLNARYIHSAFGLRYLFANLGALRSRAEILEFTIHQRPLDVVEALLRKRPSIVGFGVYIWNVAEVSHCVALIKAISPQTIVVLGGPEVSHAEDLPPVADDGDYVITGAGETRFRELCQAILAGDRPENRLIEGGGQALSDLALPYRYYTDEDVRNRMIYVEASRGCPFKCEFCLSSLDKTARPFGLPAFLREMDQLYARGARNFKFIDRTFNLKVSDSVEILEFFLERMTPGLYLHFEVIPDHLPERLKAVLQRFPPHSLQFEIGVQTFDEAIQKRISRRQDNRKTCDNIRWLVTHTNAYIHADLIFGLPGDTLENFARSFNRLHALRPHEIQLGILKRLRGAPINRHTERFGMRYNPAPPYNVLSTKDIDFPVMQRVNRFARYWDMLSNSGRFRLTLEKLLQGDAFGRFMRLSDALYRREGETWKIAQRRQFHLLYHCAVDCFGVSRSELVDLLERDYRRTGEKMPFDRVLERSGKASGTGVANRRQKRVLS